jgi:hypothetical protein
LNLNNEGFANIIAKVAKKNEKFLEEKAKESFNEVMGLANDIIHYARPYVYLIIKKESKVLKEYATHPMLFSVLHILMPFSYAIFTDLLIGNLPACFYELRVMLELIAKCYIAELHSEDLFFEDKLLSLEKTLDEKKISTSKLLEEFGKMIGLDNEPIKLWGKISEDWVHAIGIVSKIVEQVTEKSELPSYGLILPMRYSEADLTTIEELGKQVSSFRKILKTTMNKYKEERITG